MLRKFDPLLIIPIALLISCGGDDPTSPPAPSGPAGALSFVNWQEADAIAGQINGEAVAPNAGGSTSPWGLDQPSGLSSSGDAILVADRFNRRVQTFTNLLVVDGQPATYAIGQPGLYNTEPGLSASRFEPADCFSADGKFFVADASANRVLIWNAVPTGDTPADVVVGQPDFTTGTSGLSDSTMAGPVRVRAAGGKLFVLDNGNARCLIWNSIPTTNGVAADVVVGAPDFTTLAGAATQTEFGFGTGLWTDGTRLAIGDATNSRILVWNSIPTANGAPADFVIGAPDFTTIDESPEAGPKSPAAMESDGTNLFVADRTFNRVLIYSPFPTANGALPSGVLGQPDLMETDPNADPDGSGISRRVMNGPLGLLVFGTQLIVADSANNRLLAFETQ